MVRYFKLVGPLVAALTLAACSSGSSTIPTNTANMPQWQARHLARAVCPHDCTDTCAMHVSVEEGRAVKVTGDPDHPPTQGVLCTKVTRYAERVHHPERLTTPLKRVGRKGEGRFEPISWDEANRLVAERLGEIAARAPEAIVPYSYAGTMGLIQGESIAQRFFNAAF